MNTKIIFLSITLGLLSCKKDKINNKGDLMLNDTISVSYGKVYTNFENQVTIKLESVTNDSRCPTGGICDWAGDADIRFIFTANNKQTLFTLKTIGTDYSLSDTLVEGYAIKLFQLSPYPAVGKQIKQNDYSAKVMITK